MFVVLRDALPMKIALFVPDGGRTVLRKFPHTTQFLLEAFYPQHQFKLWKFSFPNFFSFKRFKVKIYLLFGFPHKHNFF